MTPILSVRNLSRNYGWKPALRQVSFDLFEGEIVGLLGLNGAGKSTALSLLSGRILPDEGRIEFRGKDISCLRDRPNRLGFVPEGAPLFEDLSVQNHLETLAGLYGLPSGEAVTAIEVMLGEFELLDVRRKQIATLSKGYKRRVALAGAFLGAPDLLLLDEPTDGLDPVQKARMLDLLRRSGTARTLLVSTHSLTDAAGLCSRLLILDRGELVFNGPTADLAASSPDGSIETAFHQLVSGGVA